VVKIKLLVAGSNLEQGDLAPLYSWSASGASAIF